MNISIKQSGFSLLELIVVVTLIGLLAAWGLEYYNEDIDDARRVSIKTLGSNFAASAMGVHAQWLLQSKQATYTGVIDLDGTAIAVNRYGWPKGVKEGNIRDQTSAFKGSAQQQHCADLWMNLLQNPSPYVLAGDADDDGARYLVSVPQPGVCRYEVRTGSGDQYYFDYFSRSGQVVASGS